MAPPPEASRRRRTELKTFIAYVEDVPGVLNRVTSLFRRRAYNIDSLTVGRTHTPGVSRMTITVVADDPTARLIEANLYKLVHVLRVEDVSHVESVCRELCFVKVRADATARAQIVQVASVFRARVVDVSPGALIAEITGDEGKIAGFVEMLRPFGIVELVRTGQLAMTRGDAAISHDPHFVSAHVPAQTAPQED